VDLLASIERRGRRLGDVSELRVIGGVLRLPVTRRNAMTSWRAAVPAHYDTAISYNHRLSQTAS
jgi:hypothetical protein